MNNTKWNEIFQIFYENECRGNFPIIRWRTRDLETGFISRWDETWTHFVCEPKDWKYIDYLQIALTKQNKEFVLQGLRKIHIPAKISEEIVTIYGYRQNVDYLT